MKVRIAEIDKIASCKNGMNLDIYGKDKRFKNPDNLKRMKIEYKSWNVEDCVGFDNSDQWEGLPDPCIWCDNPICENPKPENGMKNGKEINRTCVRVA